MNNEWYWRGLKDPDKSTFRGFIKGMFTDKKDVDASASWLKAQDMYNYFVSSSFSDGVVDIKAQDPESYKTALTSGKVRPGDIMGWDSESQGTVGHMTIVTKVDSTGIYYSGHTDPRNNFSLTEAFETYRNATIHFIRISY